MLKKKTLGLLLVLLTVIALWLPAAGAQAVEQFSTPTITSVSGTIDGDERGTVTITWDAVPGADSYGITYRHNANGWGEWQGCSITRSTSYTMNITNGVTYMFKVRCEAIYEIDSTGMSVVYDASEFSESVTYAAPLKTPAITSVTGIAGKVQIKWGAVSGAAKYRVFYKDGGNWKKLADTDATSYTWTGAKKGTYSFTVRCVSADGSAFTSAYDTRGTSYTVPGLLATPKISSVSGSAGKVKITWDAVPGAAKYRVFYKNGGSWKKLADTASNSYLWTGAKSGLYTFTVRCVGEDGVAFTSNYDTKGTSYTVPVGVLATPKISGVSGYAGNVEIAWGAVNGAEKYRVFYKNGGNWKKIADTTATSYTWTGAKSGAYTFTVRCVSANGTSFSSDYDAKGTSYTVPLSTPKISSVNGYEGNVKISWNAVSGAAKYRVFYKNDSGWKKIADTTATSYTWTGAKKGIYTFTVRCVSADGSRFTSSYNANGTSWAVQGPLNTPKISSVTGYAGNVKITWDAVPGAAKYRVFYKSGGSWKKLADTTSSSYTWKGAKAGTSTFTVRCVSADGAAFTSYYDTKGTSYNVWAFETPRIYREMTALDIITLDWYEIPGATKYRVFYRPFDSDKWIKVGDTANPYYSLSVSMSGLDIEEGKYYYFTVRCLSEDGKSYASAYNEPGFFVKYTPTSWVGG